MSTYDNYDYNPDTGIIISKITLGRCVKGSEVGSISSSGYKTVMIKGKHVRYHVLAWVIYHGCRPSGVIDHINGDILDNRLSNLRDVSYSLNSKNQKLRKTSSTKIMGVSWHKSSKRWQVRIVIQGKRIHVGTYTDFFEACCIRKSLELKHHYHLNHGRT